MPIDPRILIAIIIAVLTVVITAVAVARRKQLPPPPQKPELPEPARPAAPPAAAAPPPPAAPAVPQVVQPAEKPRAVVPAIVRAEERAELRGGLAKTRGGFVARLGKLFVGKSRIDDELLERIEEVLFTADIGVKTSQKLITQLRSDLTGSELREPQLVWQFLKAESAKLLQVGAPPLDLSAKKPFVLLTIGVNGVGKTTTIGKLAAQFSQQGHKVLLAAGDTFRAAATEQLEVWGQRTGCPVIKGKEGGDPSSVVFDAVRRGALDGYDVVICDTAGRLHTKSELMEELQKVRRVCGKALEGSPHETLLVLDATNGQNAIAQAMLFKQAMDVTGIALTKLDGTAKGGVILGICDELRLPVRYIGIGERVEDLRTFDPDAFVEALFEQTDADQAA
jgi:fused signal recognition particle receptor